MATANVSFRALKLANEQRNAYGLRYNDFARYRKHCANRTHRLRSTLKITHGKGRDFKKLPPLNPDIVKDGHLQLLLFEAERAWAYAQELITSSLLPANDSRANGLRHSATGRFRRAVHWSTQLLSLCQLLHTSSRLSAENLVEVTTYTVTLNGRFLRYRDDFEDALIQLSVARSLLDELADAASTSRDQALAILFADEIGPEIRYCAHELGRSEAYNINAIVADIAPKQRNEIVENCDSLVATLHKEGKSLTESKAKLTERLWDGQPVPVRYPELVDVLLKVEVAERTLDTIHKDSRGKKSRLGVTAYDAVLLALSDAEEVSRKLEEIRQLSGAGTSSANAGRDIHFVHGYLVYQYLSRRIQRDLLLMATLLNSDSGSKTAASKSSSRKLKPKAVDSRLYPALVKLLDTVLQSLTQMRTLSIVEDNPDLVSAVEARIAFTKSRRCVYLAHSYTATKKYAEALVLLQHATIHIRETQSSLSLSETDPITNGTPSFFPLEQGEIKEMEGTVGSDGLHYKREWFICNGGAVKSDSSTYKKPLFFNIALNYVPLDVERLQERAGKSIVTAPVARISTQTRLKAEPQPEKKPTQKAKAEETRAPTPEPQQMSRGGGLSSLLGGWWSKS